MVNEISLYYDARSTKHQNLNIALPETLFVSAAVVFLRECNAASGQLAVHVCGPLNSANKFVRKGREA